jgi:hydrogenase/urease accessory protein HupE
MVAGLAIAAGGLHGYLNGSLAAVGGLRLSGVVGITAAVFVVAALAAALVVSLRREWTRIVIRVAGSWIAAIGLLLLGWSLRSGG